MSSGTPELGHLLVNEVQKFTTGSIVIYEVRNPNLVDICTDAVFQIHMTRVLRQEIHVPVSGFLGTFQFLCGEGRVLVLADGAIDVHGDSMNKSFTCGGAPKLISLPYSTIRNSFLIHSGLAVIALQKMGYEGFISESYHDPQLSLFRGNNHLLWNIFVACNTRQDGTGVSELDTCTQCTDQTTGGFQILGENTFTIFRASSL